MPQKCCVPGCRSNYAGEDYTTVFKFPSEKRCSTLREVWIRCIHRKDYVVNKNSVVCMRHFQKEDIISFDKFTDSNGVEQTVQRRCPVLKPDAYPTIFPCPPSNLSTEPALQRKDPNIRAAEVQKRHDNDVSSWLESVLIKDFETFQSSYEKKLEQQFMSSSWHHTCSSAEYVLIYTLDIKPNKAPAIAVSIKITQDLSFSVYLRTNLVHAKKFRRICSNDKIERWSQVENLLCYCLSQVTETNFNVDDG